MRNRYEYNRRYMRKNSNPFPIALVIISSILVVATIVLSLALNKSNQNKVVNSSDAIQTPAATVQATPDNSEAEIIVLVQQLINQSIEGKLSEDIITNFEEQGVSRKSLDLLDNTLQHVPEEGLYRDGVYRGVGEGNNGPITVEVTINRGEILYIEVIEHNENAPELKEVFRSMPVAILKNQSTQNIDAISGATQISDGYINAVDNALSEAK
jgi:uncharacterized protein with FMN-binding domain